MLPSGVILVVDRNAFGFQGGVIAVDPATGKQTVFSSNQQPVNAGSQLFGDPRGGIAVLPSGVVLVGDSGRRRERPDRGRSRDRQAVDLLQRQPTGQRRDRLLRDPGRPTAHPRRSPLRGRPERLRGRRDRRRGPCLRQAEQGLIQRPAGERGQRVLRGSVQPRARDGRPHRRRGRERVRGRLLGGMRRRDRGGSCDRPPGGPVEQQPAGQCGGPALRDPRWSRGGSRCAARDEWRRSRGPPASDRIEGTSGPDVIAAQGGKDRSSDSAGRTWYAPATDPTWPRAARGRTGCWENSGRQALRQLGPRPAFRRSRPRPAEGRQGRRQASRRSRQGQAAQMKPGASAAGP